MLHLLPQADINCSVVSSIVNNHTTQVAKFRTSDHLPIHCKVSCCINRCHINNENSRHKVYQRRWDYYIK